MILDKDKVMNCQMLTNESNFCIKWSIRNWYANRSKNNCVANAMEHRQI